VKKVLETTQQVAQQSRHVHLDEQALYLFSNELLAEGAQILPWDCFYHFCGDREEMVTYLLVLDTLNFCFWPLPGETRWEIEYHSKKVSGYFGLAAALKQAIESGILITNAEYLADISSGRLKEVLGGCGKLPLFGRRVQNLNELGQVLLKKYDGNAVNLVEAAGKSAVKLARRLAEDLSSFRDVAYYQGREVFFYKRAQIFAADLCGAFDGKDWGGFFDIDKLTAFADYKLPQVLRHVGILRYGSDLAERVDNQELLEAGSPEEVEIRANTVRAVELIRQKLDSMGKTATASEIDWMLWNMGQRDIFRQKPYHRTLTIFY
jgi:hypothetical protein